MHHIRQQPPRKPRSHLQDEGAMGNNCPLDESLDQPIRRNFRLDESMENIEVDGLSGGTSSNCPPDDWSDCVDSEFIDDSGTKHHIIFSCDALPKEFLLNQSVEARA